MQPDWNSKTPKRFEGAWQLGIRDFDPSLPLVDSRDGDETEETESPGHRHTAITVDDPYPWGRAFGETRSYCAQPDEWIESLKLKHIRTACDWDMRGGFIVPSPQLCEIMALRWSGKDAEFLGADGQPAAFETPKLGASERNPCVVRLDLLRTALKNARCAIVWAVLAERTCWDGSSFVGDVRAEWSGVYTLAPTGIRGGLTRSVMEEMRGR
jgi:hypothetical protein